MEPDGRARIPMDAAAAGDDEPAPPSSAPVQENVHTGPAQNPVEPDPPPSMNRCEIVNALEMVERDSAAIAESFSSLFSSLRLALSEVPLPPPPLSLPIPGVSIQNCSHNFVRNRLDFSRNSRYEVDHRTVTSASIDNMECFSDVVGRLQESALDAASKGNKYINSCLRLNEEMKGLESLSMQLKILRKNADLLDLAVSRLLQLP